VKCMINFHIHQPQTATGSREAPLVSPPHVFAWKYVVISVLSFPPPIACVQVTRAHMQ